MDEEERKQEASATASPLPSVDAVVSLSSSITSDAAPADDISASTASASKENKIITSKAGLKRKLASSSSAADAKKHAAAPFSLFDTVPPTSPLIDTYRSCLLSHFFPGERQPPRSSLTSLPGPQPASLTRADLSKIEDGQYWVCEKSDGERCILLIHHASSSVLMIDRRYTCRVMRSECAELLVKLFAIAGDTVIDTELIELERSADDGGLLYRLSMFDVLAVNGERVAERPFGGIWNNAPQPVSDGSGRLDVILNRIAAPYRDAMAGGKTEQSASVALLERHLELFVKEFVPKHHVEKILARIRHAPSSSSQHFTAHLYTFKGRATNSNDGLIFTPDLDDYYARDTPLLKWKWPDLNTIDFTIHAPYTVQPDRGLPLVCAGHCRGDRRRSGEQEAQVHDIVFDHIRRLDVAGAALLDEVRRRGVSSAVVECGYSRADSDWHIKCVRWDKSSSNFLTTVLATIKAIMDDLQSADIVQACKKHKFAYRRTA